MTKLIEFLKKLGEAILILVCSFKWGFLPQKFSPEFDWRNKPKTRVSEGVVVWYSCALSIVFSWYIAEDALLVWFNPWIYLILPFAVLLLGLPLLMLIQDNRSGYAHRSWSSTFKLNASAVFFGAVLFVGSALIAIAMSSSYAWYQLLVVVLCAQLVAVTLFFILNPDTSMNERKRAGGFLVAALVSCSMTLFMSFYYFLMLVSVVVVGAAWVHRGRDLWKDIRIEVHRSIWGKLEAEANILHLELKLTQKAAKIAEADLALQVEVANKAIETVDLMRKGEAELLRKINDLTLKLTDICEFKSTLALIITRIRNDRRRGDKHLGEARRDLERFFAVLVPDENERLAQYYRAEHPDEERAKQAVS